MSAHRPTVAATPWCRQVVRGLLRLPHFVRVAGIAVATPRMRPVIVTWVAIALVLVSLPARADPTPSAIRSLVARTTATASGGPDPPALRSAVQRFYLARDYRPAWLGEGQPAPVTEAALRQLRLAHAHGLVVEDYDVERITRALAQSRTVSPSGAGAAALEVALTRALLRFLIDLHGGRVASRDVGFHLARAGPEFDAAAALLELLAGRPWSEMMPALEPSLPIYARLEAALARYRLLARQAWPSLPPLPRGRSRVDPGDRYAGTPALVARLVAFGDLPAGTEPGDDLYSEAIAEGLRSFQRRHGLVEDGVLGRNSFAELVVPIATRVRQIELAIERMRWLPHGLPQRMIVVNIPAFTLVAFDGGDVPVLRSGVIVGKAAPAQRTPVFIGEMRAVEFSPYWNVPPSIQVKELVPTLVRDPGYLVREDMEIVGPGRNVALRTTIDDATLASLRDGTARVRQRPGPRNALGGIKFSLPNSMNVYLHATPARELFRATRRDFSHGCIRVADVLGLAAFVLHDRPDWTPERMRTAMAQAAPEIVPLTQAIPVVIFYTTAIVSATGELHFLPDVYGHDRTLDVLLLRRSAALRAARDANPLPAN